MKISERPEFKSKKPPITFFENDRVIDAVKAMTKDNFGSVVITDKQSKVRGMLQKETLEKLLYKSMNPKTTKLKDIMTSPVKVADKDDEMVIWLRQMSNERFRHVPVVINLANLLISCLKVTLFLILGQI